MKVLIVTPRYYPNTPGGGARSIHLIAKGLSEHVDLEVYCQDGAEFENGVVEGIRVSRRKPRFNEKMTVNLKCFKDIFRKNEYDLLHSYNMDLMPAVGLLAKLNPVKTVATLNGRVYSRHSEWYDNIRNNPSTNQRLIGTSLLIRNTLMKEFVKQIHEYTVLCQYRREVFVREGLNREKITVVPNILDLEFQAEKPVFGDILRILFVGSMNWLKGLDILLQAYSLLDKGNIELIIVGVEQKDFRKIPKCNNPVTFKGRIPYNTIPKIYANADIYINSYRYPEPVSRSVMEAMQSGLPVITTGTPALSPIVRDGRDGVLVYPNTPKKMADAIQFLIDNPRLRRKMGQSAFTRVNEVCHPRRIAKLYLEVYRKTLEGIHNVS